MSDELDSALASAFSGASIFMLGRVTHQALGFIFNLILTNGLSTAGYGVFTYANAIMRFLLNFTDLGTDNALMRFLPESHSNAIDQERVLGLAGLSVVVAGFGCAVVLYLTAPTISQYTLNDSSFVFVLRAFAFVLPFQSLTRVAQNTFRAFELPKYQLGISEVLTPGSQLVAGAIAVGLGYAVEGVATAILIVAILLFLMAGTAVLSMTGLRPRLSVQRNRTQEFYEYSLPLTINAAASFLASNIDILMIGFFSLGSSAVGYYRVSVILATVVALPISGFNQLFPPRASRLYSAGNLTELGSLYSVVTRWALTATLPIAISLFVYRVSALSIFGGDFTTAQTVLAILVLFRLAETSAGPCGYMLMMTDRQNVVMVNNLGMALSNIVLNFIFISVFGLIGAAVATAVSVISINIIMIVEVWWFEGIVPYKRSFYKPVIAGAISFVSMIVIRKFLPIFFKIDSIAVMFIGGGVGVATFAAFISIFGIEEADRQLISSLMSR